jgi:hypothetical protein
MGYRLDFGVVRLRKGWNSQGGFGFFNFALVSEIRPLKVKVSQKMAILACFWPVARLLKELGEYKLHVRIQLGETRRLMVSHLKTNERGPHRSPLKMSLF